MTDNLPRLPSILRCDFDRIADCMQDCEDGAYIQYEAHLECERVRDLRERILLQANAQLREAVEALVAELRKEAAEMRQPEGGVIREIVDKFCPLLTPRRREWRDHPDRNA